MPAAERRGLAVGTGSPVYHLVCFQSGPVMPDEKTIKADISCASNLSRAEPREWRLGGVLARRGLGRLWSHAPVRSAPLASLVEVDESSSDSECTAGAYKGSFVATTARRTSRMPAGAHA